MTTSPPALELCVCPACGGPLAAADKDQAVACQAAACGRRYPVLDKLAWLLPEPQAAIGNWKALSAIESDRLAVQAERLKQAMKAPDLSPLASRRLQKHLQGTVEQGKALAKLLEPLAVKMRGEDEAVEPFRRAMLAKLPATQSLTAYYANLHRDWAWDEDVAAAGDRNENEASLAALLGVLPQSEKPQRVLVLGAGAARLAYDLHRALRPALTLATDVNPLMLYAAARIVRGRAVTLYEFPIAPVDGDSFAVARKHRAPEAADDGFQLLFANAMNPPFKEEAWDLVLTPWLIDIVPQEPKRFFPKINRLLKPGGLWLNFGSVAFRGPGHERQYAKDETLALAAAAGFAVEAHSFERIPYLQSPASCNGRVERVLTFAARKTGPAPATTPFRYLPEWVTDPDKPIPALPAFQRFTMAHAYYAQTMSAVDGRRSAREVAALLAQTMGMVQDDALETFVRFLTTVYEEDVISG